MPKKKTQENPVLREINTVQQVAAYLQICTQQVIRYIKDGKLPASQLVPNGKWRIPASSVEKLLESTRHKVA